MPEGREFPARSLIVGVPARQAGEVTEEQTQDIARGVRSYVERAVAHREALRRDLKRLDLRGKSIAIGTATDPYQPAERRYRITR